jgi:hypothetical protein
VPRSDSTAAAESGAEPAELGDDQWVPLVSGSGEGEGAARAAGPAGPRSDARELGCGGLLLRGLGCSACWMPDATVQLVIGPLFWRGVFFFSRRVRKDVLRGFFSTEDFLW